MVFNKSNYRDGIHNQEYHYCKTGYLMRCKLSLILQEGSCLVKISARQCSLIVGFTVTIFWIIFQYFGKDCVEALLPDPRDPSSKVILPSTIVAMCMVYDQSAVVPL